jgi:RND family efflux transporter MFP subunit
MKKVINILILVAILAVIVLQLRNNKTESENRVYTYDKEKPIAVHTSVIKTTNISFSQQFTGTFDANKDAKINADIQGKITEFYVDAGSVVKTGQPLVKLDDVLLKLQLEAVNVQIDGLETDEKRYLVLTAAEAIQGVQLEKTQMALKAAKIQRSTLQEQIAKTTIKAPFNGVVTMKMSEVGSFAAPGVPLLMLLDATELKFTVNVSESDLNLFSLKKQYDIVVDAYPNLVVSGVVTSVGNKGNMGNSFPVELALKNTPDLKIKANMFGKLDFKNDVETTGIAINSSAIVGSNNTSKVYVLTNGKAILKEVTIEKRIQNQVVISSGLNVGDTIITTGLINLFDGANITTKE